jgi:hypothetical protein
VLYLRGYYHRDNRCTTRKIYHYRQITQRAAHLWLKQFLKNRDYHFVNTDTDFYYSVNAHQLARSIINGAKVSQDLVNK